ncbi:MAG: hypothetical protein HZB46_12640 [Solirubrobacterales bacterium]|nr:hypothetical protein [Solirubrobacterales bacterium]
MRLRSTVLALFAAALLAPAAATASPPVSSDNVQLLTRLPEAVSAISARFSADGKVMYVSTATGLLTYDVTDPADPQRLGALPLPHFENEDVDVGDGVVVLTNDPSFTELGMIYVVDVKDPASPTLRSSLTTYLPVGDSLGEAQTGNGHILNCIQGCKYLWSTGTDEGITVYDLRDLDNPAFLGKFEMPAVSRSEGAEATPGFTHDVFVDKQGIGWITGEDGTFGYDTTGDPVHPKLVYRSDEGVKNTGGGLPQDDGEGPLDFLHHNSIRTDIQLAQEPLRPPTAAPAPAPAADEAIPASGQSPAKAPAPRRHAKIRYTKAEKRALRRCAKRKSRKARSKCRAAIRRKAQRRADRRAAAKVRMKPSTTPGGLGDVLAVTEEDYLKPGCKGQGSLQTWQITGERNSDGTVKLKMLDQWTTDLNELASSTGRSPATGNCSAHWFDEDKGLLAQGWYDQGVRFMDISNPRDIKQVGWFISAGTYWGAYFAPTDPTRQTVYALDTAGGIDVLHIDRGAGPGATKAPILDRWLTQDSGFTVASERWGFACPLLSPGIVAKAREVAPS